jgi:hypothetical protein
MIKRLHIALSAFTIFVILSIIGCKREKSNMPPRILFTQPVGNIVLTSDSVLTFVVDAFDDDGSIVKVEFFVNGTVAHTVTAIPYQYSWNDATLNNLGVHTIKATAYDNEGATSDAEITVEMLDSRQIWVGNFEFNVFTENWMMGQATNYDTTIYHGEIRNYVSADDAIDLSSFEVEGENPNEKITIEFLANTYITSVINPDGSLVTKLGYHYGHSGGFIEVDTIAFQVGGLGGLGFGTNYTIVGVRE